MAGVDTHIEQANNNEQANHNEQAFGEITKIGSDFQVKSFYDENTATLTYVVMDFLSRDALVIDPVLDYDTASSTVSTENLDRLEQYLRLQELKVHYCLETHAHADHLSGAQELKKRFPEMQLAIGERIREVQEVFKKVYNLSPEFIPNGSQFNVLLKDREIRQAGTLKFEVINTPGHTPACVSYLIGNAVFTGDAIFMPDTGTGRCDFPKGSSVSLFESVSKKLYSLPDETRVFVGHDYKCAGKRELRCQSTIGEEKLSNVQLKASTTLEDYVRFRDERDATLSLPKLLLPSLQVNIEGGRLPLPESNGVSYLKIPLKIS
jgi:glyoxylase-like metal-dependent hydrolase (beta-lactamase superfamily II)